MGVDLASTVQAASTILQAVSQAVPISQLSLAAVVLFMVSRSINPNDVQGP
jgi:hypothetical protein